MGWMWNSAPASRQSPSDDSTIDPHTSTSRLPSHESPTTSKLQKPPHASRSPPTQDELAEAELRSFFQSLEPSTTPVADAAPNRASKNSSSTIPEVSDQPGPTPLTTAHTLPSTVSCRTIFDNAFHCQSLGGQWNSVYRHGGFRNCSELWYDFWWCMATNRGSMADEERERKVRRRYEEKEKVLRAGPNSEDVWEQRKTLFGPVWNERYEDEERGDDEKSDKTAPGRGSMKGLYGG